MSPGGRAGGRVGGVRRALVAAGGAAMLAFGVGQVLTLGSGVGVAAVAAWLAVVLVVHDGLLAPLTVLAGRVIGRVIGRAGPLPAAVRAVLGAGLAVGAVLVLVALPALLRPGPRPDPSVLPRDYGRGLAVLLALDAAACLLVVVVRYLWDRRSAGAAVRSPSGPSSGAEG